MTVADAGYRAALHVMRTGHANALPDTGPAPRMRHAAT